MFKVNNEDARTTSLRRCSAFTLSFEPNAGWEDDKRQSLPNLRRKTLKTIQWKVHFQFHPS